MTYIGTEPAAAYTTPTKQTIAGTGVATYTLDYNVATEHDIQVFLNNVRQEGGTGKAYTVADNQITFASNISSTDSLYVIFSHKAVQTLVSPDLSITTGMLKDDAVTRAKLADDLSGTNLALDTTSSTFKMTDLSTNAFYRQGTWTPVWSSSGATDKTASITTGTYTAQVGTYVRIGDLVFYTAFINSPSTWTYTNGGATGQFIYLAGLPFKGANSPNGAQEQWGTSVSWVNNVDWTASYSMQALVRNDERYIRFYYVAASVSTGIQTNIFDRANSQMYITGTYRTDEA